MGVGRRGRRARNREVWRLSHPRRHGAAHSTLSAVRRRGVGGTRPGLERRWHILWQQESVKGCEPCFHLGWHWIGVDWQQESVLVVASLCLLAPCCALDTAVLLMFLFFSLPDFRQVTYYLIFDPQRQRIFLLHVPRGRLMRWIFFWCRAVWERAPTTVRSCVFLTF